MPKSIYKTETAAMCGALLDELLTNFPVPVTFQGHELALKLGYSVDVTTNEITGPTYEFSNLPSGVEIQILAGYILNWFALEGYTYNGETSLNDVVLSGKGLRALEEHSDFIIETLLDRVTKKSVSSSDARSGS